MRSKTSNYVPIYLYISSYKKFTVGEKELALEREPLTFL